MEAHVVPVADAAAIYNEEYYRKHCGPIPYERNGVWLSFFGTVADTIVRTVRPKTAIDVGCAFGLLVESLWDRNVIAVGIDVSPTSIGNVRADMRSYCRLMSIFDLPEERYDVATCMEVLEHLPPGDCERAVAKLASLSDTIVFSSTPTDLDEPTHLNVRPTLAWLESFAQVGLAPDVRTDLSAIAPHAILFRKASAPIEDDSLFAFAEIVRARMQRAKEAADLHVARQDIENVRAEGRLELERERARYQVLDEHRLAAIHDREAAQAQLSDLKEELGREKTLHAEDVSALAAAQADIQELEMQLAATTESLERAVRYLEEERAQLQHQINATSLMTQYVVHGKFWKLKRLVARLLRRPQAV